MTPSGVIRPIALVAPPSSVNHRLPSAPGAIELRRLPAFRPAENSVIDPARRDPPDRAGGTQVGEPQVAVGAGRDAARGAAGVQPGGELADRTARRDPPDRPRKAARVGEPQVAVGARRDGFRGAAGVQAGGELADDPTRRDPPDRPGGPQVGEPKVAVGARGDALRVTAFVQPGRELADRPRPS